MNNIKRSFSSLFSILCLALHANGQPTAATVTATPSQLPFLYLNQYFQYDIKSQDEIFLAGKIFNFANFKISVSNSKAEVELLLLKPWIMKNSSLVFRIKQTQLLIRLLSQKKILITCFQFLLKQDHFA